MTIPSLRLHMTYDLIPIHSLGQHMSVQERQIVDMILLDPNLSQRFTNDKSHVIRSSQIGLGNLHQIVEGVHQQGKVFLLAFDLRCVYYGLGYHQLGADELQSSFVIDFNLHLYLVFIAEQHCQILLSGKIGWLFSGRRGHDETESMLMFLDCIIPPKQVMLLLLNLSNIRLAYVCSCHH
jgi:hypothetical protein